MYNGGPQGQSDKESRQTHRGTIVFLIHLRGLEDELKQSETFLDCSATIKHVSKLSNTTTRGKEWVIQSHITYDRCYTTNQW